MEISRRRARARSSDSIRQTRSTTLSCARSGGRAERGQQGDRCGTMAHRSFALARVAIDACLSCGPKSTSLYRHYRERTGQHETGTRMKTGFVTAMICLAILGSGGAHGDDGTAQTPLTCSVGPVEQTYGNTKWLVFSCDDGQSVVIVSAPGSPANPFVFRFMALPDGYVLQSKGTGDRQYTAAAYGELKQLSVEDVAALVRMTRVGAGQ